MKKPDSIRITAPHTFEPWFYLEDELEDLPEDWEPTKENIKSLISEKHFKDWLENMWEHYSASWDSNSFVSFWKSEKSDIKIEVGFDQPYSPSAKA